MLAHIKRVSIDGFDYRDNRYELHGTIPNIPGEPRSIFVLDCTALAINNFLDSKIPVPIMPELSIIPNGAKNKPAGMFFPIFYKDFEYLKSGIKWFLSYQLQYLLFEKSAIMQTSLKPENVTCYDYLHFISDLCDRDVILFEKRLKQAKTYGYTIQLDL